MRGLDEAEDRAVDTSPIIRTRAGLTYTAPKYSPHFIDVIRNFPAKNEVAVVTGCYSCYWLASTVDNVYQPIREYIFKYDDQKYHERLPKKRSEHTTNIFRWY